MKIVRRDVVGVVKEYQYPERGNREFGFEVSGNFVLDNADLVRIDDYKAQSMKYR
jgi:hypothetical protein